MSIERLSVDLQVEHDERAVKADIVLILMPLPRYGRTFAVRKLEVYAFFRHNMSHQCWACYTMLFETRVGD